MGYKCSNFECSFPGSTASIDTWYNTGWYYTDYQYGVITRFAKYGFLIYFTTNQWMTYYGFVGGELKIKAGSSGSTVSPSQIYILSYKKRSLTFNTILPNNPIYTVSLNGLNKITINNVSFFQALVPNGIFGSVISAAPEEWGYLNLSGSELQKTYDSSFYRVLKLKYNNYNHYFKYSGNDIDDQLDDISTVTGWNKGNFTDIALLSGSGNYFLKLQDNWLQKRNLNTTIEKEENYRDTLTNNIGYKLQTNKMQVMNPFSGAYAHTESGSYRRDIDTNQQDLGEPTPPSISYPQWIGDTFFNHNPVDEQITLDNLTRHCHWIDQYHVYCCKKVYAVPDDWTIGVYYSEGGQPTDIVWNANWGQSEALVNLYVNQSISELWFNWTPSLGQQSLKVANTMSYYNINQDNTRTSGSSLPLISRTYSYTITAAGVAANNAGWNMLAQVLIANSDPKSMLYQCTYKCPNARGFTTASISSTYPVFTSTITQTKTQIDNTYGTVTVLANIYGQNTYSALSLGWRTPVIHGLFRPGQYCEPGKTLQEEDYYPDPAGSPTEHYKFLYQDSGHSEGIGKYADWKGGHYIDWTTALWRYAVCYVVYDPLANSNDDINPINPLDPLPIEHE